MKGWETCLACYFGAVCILVGVTGVVLAEGEPKAQPHAAGKIREVNVGGYLMVAHSRAPEACNAGFSFYTAAWPLAEKYQGHRFQSGLYGTWMHAQLDKPAPKKLYSDIEGGLGWWRDTNFPTETPKFLMGGVGPNFCSIANGPGHGWGDGGLYGIAQLSPWLLFPLDGLNVRQGACGELFGYGYLALPLTPAKDSTDGANVPTGDRSWTLFLSTKNFKGPVAFFTPYFWSRTTVKRPEFGGMLLDSRPCSPNRPMSMETQHIPAAVSEGPDGASYLRTASTLFPVDADGNSVLVHRLTGYSEDALWNAVKRWFEGGAAASGSINADGAVVQKVSDGGAGWKIWPAKKGEEPVPLAWKAIASPYAADPETFGYKWTDQATRTKIGRGSVVKLPEYYRLGADGKEKPVWTPISPKDVPENTKLAALTFDTPAEPASEPRTTPEGTESCWKKPGPAAGPFRARLGDGSVVTYYWYRFIDQPAMLNAGLTEAEREQLQKRVEMIHRAWPKDRDYLAPPTVGTLVDLDPALLVTPPEGMEAGYVPIATRQESGASTAAPRGN